MPASMLSSASVFSSSVSSPSRMPLMYVPKTPSSVLSACSFLLSQASKELAVTAITRANSGAHAVLISPVASSRALTVVRRKEGRMQRRLDGIWSSEQSHLSTLDAASRRTDPVISTKAWISSHRTLDFICFYSTDLDVRKVNVYITRAITYDVVNIALFLERISGVCAFWH